MLLLLVTALSASAQNNGGGNKPSEEDIISWMMDKLTNFTVKITDISDYPYQNWQWNIAYTYDYDFDTHILIVHEHVEGFSPRYVEGLTRSSGKEFHINLNTNYQIPIKAIKQFEYKSNPCLALGHVNGFEEDISLYFPNTYPQLDIFSFGDGVSSSNDVTRRHLLRIKGFTAEGDMPERFQQAITDLKEIIKAKTPKELY